jgi:plasmid stabilization system protein ParE
MKAAREWYMQRSVQAADGFYEELLTAFDRARRNPKLYPPHAYGTRRAVLTQYPFSVIFRDLPHRIQIIAVAHAKLRPSYWANRL